MEADYYLQRLKLKKVINSLRLWRNICWNLLFLMKNYLLLCMNLEDFDTRQSARGVRSVSRWIGLACVGLA